MKSLKHIKMKHSILTFIAIFTIGSVFAQEISRDLIGKWQLQTIKVSGATMTPQDAFQTSEVYQTYKENSDFVSSIGSEANKGTWKLSKNKKNITVKVQGQESQFSIKSFAKDEMTLETENQGQLLVLKYHKVQKKIRTKDASDITILDDNKDGIINPYEALDVLLSMQKETDEKLSLKKFSAIVTKYKKAKEKETEDIFKEVDKNKNNIIEMNEAPEEMMQFLQLMDADQSQSVTKEEMANFNFETALFPGEEALKAQAKGILDQFSGGKNHVTIKDAPEEVKDEITSWDKNADGKLTEKEIFKGLEAGASSAKFEVKGNVAYMNGTISSSTPAAVLELVFEHPEVKTIEMLHVPGSIDDVANLRASLYVHKFGLNTRVTSKSIIASGGTDFFLAGHKRTIEKGAKIGVHSWSGGPTAATDLPKNHDAHKKYLDYYKQVNIPAAFYWYTLNAAPADSIHNMTEKEIVKYKVRTN